MFLFWNWRNACAFVNYCINLLNEYRRLFNFVVSFLCKKLYYDIYIDHPECIHAEVNWFNTSHVLLRTTWKIFHSICRISLQERLNVSIDLVALETNFSNLQNAMHKGHGCVVNHNVFSLNIKDRSYRKSITLITNLKDFQ